VEYGDQLVEAVGAHSADRQVKVDLGRYPDAHSLRGGGDWHSPDGTLMDKCPARDRPCVSVIDRVSVIDAVSVV
jgi:hypothetical protein